MKKINKPLHAIFFIIVILEIISRWFDNQSLEYVAKPFIMVWITVYYVLNERRNNLSISLLLAFFFSWLGDIFLMLAHKNELLFFAGVGGFLLAQCFFIYTFLKADGSNKIGLLSKKPFFLVFFLIVLLMMVWYLFDGLEGIMIPIVIVYGLSLVGMSAAAFNRLGKANISSFRLVFYGSVAFVISDTLIAVTKFKADIPKASLIIMVTYILAEYMIMRGMLIIKPGK